MKELQLVSNTIKLEKDKEYMFIFDSRLVSPETVQSIADSPEIRHIKGVFIVIENAEGLKIVEKSNKK